MATSGRCLRRRAVSIHAVRMVRRTITRHDPVYFVERRLRGRAVYMFGDRDYALPKSASRNFQAFGMVRSLATKAIENVLGDTHALIVRRFDSRWRRT
jgi:hypothetical protein